MAEKHPQTFANHTRFDPLFHFFLLPVVALTVLGVIFHSVRDIFREPGMESASHGIIHVVWALALLILVFKVRLYAVKVQDRVIRLEERLRLTQLLSEPLRSRIPELNEDQLCALRFASDGEVAKLAERALNEKLSRKDIKAAIKEWRPDYWRV
jgi:hypothetical protein